MANGKVREWIGPRIIPVFADDVQWDITKTYEPLNMVQNAGDTFMSRQYVPAGIPLPNTGSKEESNDYWVHMSNWNAQIEAYRQEVLTFNGRITDCETELNETVYFVTPEQFGAIGDGKTDDSAAIQSAVDKEKVVIFDGSKTYFCSKSITLPTWFHLLGNGTKISFAENCGFEITMEGRFVHQYMNGFNLIGTNYTGNAINITGTQKPDGYNPEADGSSGYENINITEFENGIEFGSYYESCLTLNNIYVFRCAKFGIHFKASDCKLSQIYVTQCKVGMYLRGVNNLVSDSKFFWNGRIYGSDNSISELGIRNNNYVYSCGLLVGGNGRHNIVNCSFEDNLFNGISVRSTAQTCNITNFITDGNGRGPLDYPEIEEYDSPSNVILNGVSSCTVVGISTHRGLDSAPVITDVFSYTLLNCENCYVDIYDYDKNREGRVLNSEKCIVKDTGYRLAEQHTFLSTDKMGLYYNNDISATAYQDGCWQIYVAAGQTKDIVAQSQNGSPSWLILSIVANISIDVGYTLNDTFTKISTLSPISNEINACIYEEIPQGANYTIRCQAGNTFIKLASVVPTSSFDSYLDGMAESNKRSFAKTIANKAILKGKSFLITK